jgi:hypothetical protein
MRIFFAPFYTETDHFAKDMLWTNIGKALTRGAFFSQARGRCDLPVEHWLEVRKTVVLSHLYIKCIILPRQARDKHRESTQNRVDAFSL